MRQVYCYQNLARWAASVSARVTRRTGLPRSTLIASSTEGALLWQVSCEFLASRANKVYRGLLHTGSGLIHPCADLEHSAQFFELCFEDHDEITLGEGLFEETQSPSDPADVE